MSASPSNNLASEGEGHQFCYVYWEHGRNSKTSLYYLDTPNPLRAPVYSTFVPEETLESFINRLKQVGWQEYMSQADQEVYVKAMLRPPVMDKQFEYCLLTCKMMSDGSKPPTLVDLYLLGEKNAGLKGGRDYNGALQYLKRGGWELTNQQDYPFSVYMPNILTQLRYYKRPVSTSFWSKLFASP